MQIPSDGGGIASEPAAPWLGRLLLLLLFAELGYHWIILDKLNIHWDEFLFLSQVYSAKRGDLASQLQTFHVHLFHWVTTLSGQEVEQVVYARRCMFVMHGLTLLILYQWLRPIGRVSALFSLVAYSSVYEVLVHGASFRADPMLTLVLAISLRLFSDRRFLPSIVSGLLFGLSTALSIKSFICALYLLLCSSQGKTSITRMFAFLTALSLSFATLIVYHRTTLVSQDVGLPASSLYEIATGFLFDGVSKAGVNTTLVSLSQNPLYWSLIIVSFYTAVRTGVDRRVSLISFSFFLMSMFLYRNAWPYYMPLTLIFLLKSQTCFAFVLLKCKCGGNVLAIFALALVIHSAVTFENLLVDRTATQREFIRTVHEQYPDRPGAYIDRCGMISSFPMRGPFLSSWQILKYRRAGIPVYKNLLATTDIQFLIRNSPTLRKNDDNLLEEDLRAIEQAFPYCEGIFCRRTPFTTQPVFVGTIDELFWY